VVAATLVAQLGLLGLATRALIANQRQEVLITRRLRSYPPVTLFSFGFSLALQNRGVPQRVVELWDTAPTGARPGDLVLFAPEPLAAKWRGQPLMKNFDRLRPFLAQPPLEDFGDGWFLYRVDGSLR